MENLFIHSPCQPIASINRRLPLELFDMAKCKTLFDHFWRFKITEAEKEDLLGQLLGPPRLMQYLFEELTQLEKPAENVTYEDLQTAVDQAIASYSCDLGKRLENVVDGYETYMKIVLYPENYQGIVEDTAIVYPPKSEGYNILLEKGAAFADSSVLRVYKKEENLIVEMPSRATQLVMSHRMFPQRKEVSRPIIQILF